MSKPLNQPLGYALNDTWEADAHVWDNNYGIEWYTQTIQEVRFMLGHCTLRAERERYFRIYLYLQKRALREMDLIV